MTSTLVGRGTLVVDEELQSSATKVMKAAGDEEIIGLTFTTTTGRQFPLDPVVVDFVGRVLSRVAQGGNVSVRTLPETLTTSAAADLLGVSRPTVMKFIRNGELDSDMAGTHHRLRLNNVVELREKRESARRAAIAELLELDEDDS